MARPPHARESALDAWERLLIDAGERAATLEATARAAGVSKGGLLYHFGSKDALEAALLERLRMLVDADVTAIRSAPEGGVAYFLRTSVMADDALDRAVIAASRLAQGGSEAAAAALADMRERWSQTLEPLVRDETARDIVLLLSDGLYFNNALAGAVAANLPRGKDLDALIARVVAATAP